MRTSGLPRRFPPFGLAALVALTSACASMPPGAGRGDDDDRPPIIVSSGSAYITAEPDKYGLRGFFAGDGTDVEWHHYHHGVRTASFEVKVEGSTACPSTYGATKLQIEFDITGRKKKLTIDIDDGDLRIKTDGVRFERPVGVPHRVENASAELTGLKIKDGAGKGTTCTFDGERRAVTIGQVRRMN